MSDWELVVVAGAIILAATAVFARLRANVASKSGELKYSISGKEHVIRREDDPRRFEIELGLLRAAPWVAAGAAAFVLLFLGAPA